MIPHLFFRPAGVLGWGAYTWALRIIATASYEPSAYVRRTGRCRVDDHQIIRQHAFA
jgi:hypothetical protein